MNARLAAVSLIAALALIACQDATSSATMPPPQPPASPPQVSPPAPPSSPPPATPPVAPPVTPPPSSADIYAQNRLLAKTVNFGNALEAPNEGDWGMRLEEGFFGLVKDAGFTAIRLPVKWSNHAAQTAPYTLEPAFLERVRWAVKQATDRNLAIIVDFHHYDEIVPNPTQHLERFLGIWKNVAAAFKDAPSSVFFEVLNEPNGALEPYWNEYQTKALEVIRQSNPTRAVIVGPTGWNSAWRLGELKLPNDPRLIVTFHNYEPFSFTHQGAEWINPVPPVGVPWPVAGASLRAGWQNWSWNTRLEASGDTAFNVTFQQGWAGLYLHNDAGETGAKTLRLQTDRGVKLRLLCLENNLQSGNPPSLAVTTLANAVTEINLSACGNPATLRDLMLQSDSPDAQPAFKLSTLELKGDTKTVNLVSNARSSVTEFLEAAAAWGKANNRPLFMGEFGAYGKADLDSRVRWTEYTRREAERLGISWGYWEFGAGFGVYDRAAKAWITPLLKALIPN
jgi:aryl-phospho-beta-D-glucosidase BglC (GH1 family)